MSHISTPVPGDWSSSGRCIPAIKLSFSVMAGGVFRNAATCALALLATAAILYFPRTLDLQGRVVLCVLVLSMIGWTMTKFNDTQIALAAVAVLAASGALDHSQMTAALGHEMIWLLMTSFVVAGALTATGAPGRLVQRLLRNARSVAGLFYTITGVIIASAFLVPSTTGRAALFLPVFLALSATVSDKRLIRPLAILFPTIILLSACASLIGAGAHIIAVDYIAKTTGERVDFAGWLRFGLPFALVTSLAAARIIFVMFVPADLRLVRFCPPNEPHEKLSWPQRRVVLIAVAIVAGWLSEPLHGIDIVLVSLVGAVVLMSPAITGCPVKQLLKSIEIELVLFLAATFAMVGAMHSSGADRWLAGSLLALFDISTLLWHRSSALAVLSLIALSAHLVVTSRTARATVLIPAIALPLAGYGHDPKLLILVTVLGTGLCQSTMASAKPVALYGNLEFRTYEGDDLRRLSLALAPLMFVALMAFAAVYR